MEPSRYCYLLMARCFKAFRSQPKLASVSNTLGDSFVARLLLCGASAVNATKKIREKQWIFMISEGFLGNLGVNPIYPAKLCAGLASRASRETLP